MGKSSWWVGPVGEYVRSVVRLGGLVGRWVREVGQVGLICFGLKGSKFHYSDSV